LVADALEAPRPRHDARIGGVDAVDVRVDVALLRLQGRRHGHGGGVGAAAAQRGDVAVLVDALEPGDHHDAALFQHLADPGGVDVHDARLVVDAVGEDAYLATGEGYGVATLGLQADGEQREGPLPAGGEEHVQLPAAGARRQVPGEPEQAIGPAAHGRDHDHHLVSLA